MVDAVPLASYKDYQECSLRMQFELVRRERYEKSLLKDADAFSVEGFCYVCNKEVNFLADYLYAYEKKDGMLIPNWRERLVCPSCGLNNRMRASIQLFEQFLHPSSSSKIYICEQATHLYEYLHRHYPNLVGSEFLGDHIRRGEKDNSGIRNENITELSFPDNEFDFVLSFDVFEHVPDFRMALRECHRILKRNGSLFFSVPFDFNSEENIVKAIEKEDGEIEHLLPPEYHGDPMNPKGCLAFYYFGWEILQQLEEIGFAAPTAHLYWSQEFGYLGREQVIFIAEKREVV
jgi:hypothetical protein